jgi:hypothetical protein
MRMLRRARMIQQSRSFSSKKIIASDWMRNDADLTFERVVFVPTQHPPGVSFLQSFESAAVAG